MVRIKPVIISDRNCKYCKSLLYKHNKSGVCSPCQKQGNPSKLKEELKRLKKEFERYKTLSDRVLLDYYKKLKKYEPDMEWDTMDGK